MNLPPLPEPDSYLFQHDETGQTMFVDSQQVEWGFEKNNPRLHKIGGAFTEKQLQDYARQAQREELRRLAGAALVNGFDLNAMSHAEFAACMADKREFPMAANPAAITALLDELDRADESYALLFAENARLRSEVSACSSLVFAVESAMHNGVLPMNVECAYDAMEAK